MKKYALSKLIPVGVGAEFIASHLCERLPEKVDKFVCLNNFYANQGGNIVYLVLLLSGLLELHQTLHRITICLRAVS